LYGGGIAFIKQIGKGGGLVLRFFFLNAITGGSSGNGAGAGRAEWLYFYGAFAFRIGFAVAVVATGKEGYAY
jgi:hypothetical protein